MYSTFSSTLVKSGSSQLCAPPYLLPFVYSYILSALPLTFVLLDGKFFIVDAPYTLNAWPILDVAIKQIIKLYST